MTVRVYRSTDASAPILSGSAGTLVALLDACLVNGYGSKSPAGWQKAFASGSTRAAYRQGPGSNGFYFYLDDTGTFKVGSRGYETMTSIDVGIQGFPTVNMDGGTAYIWKSDRADAVTRPWTLIATERAFYLLTSPALGQVGAGLTAQTAMFFGDFTSNFAGDKYNTMIIASDSNSSITTSNRIILEAPVSTAITIHSIARAWHQMGQSQYAGKSANFHIRNLVSLPQVTDGKIWISPFEVSDTYTWISRGQLPCMYRIHQAGGTNGTVSQWLDGYQFTIPDNGTPLANKTLEFHPICGVAFAFEISDTW